LRSVSSSLGYKIYPIGIENSDTGELTGIFPLAQVKNFVSSSKLISFPLSTHCEPLISEKLIEDIYDKINPELKKNDYMELRSLDYSCTLKKTVLNENYLIHILELEESEDETFQKFHGTSVRASIRRAEKNGLTFEINNSIPGLKAFYSLYTDLRTRLGLPFLSYNFFNSIYENLIKADRILIPLVKYGNHVVAAGFILKFKDTFSLEYTASDNSRLNLYPNHKLFWEIIKIAINDKAKYVDFGRTEMNNVCLITFKEKWNTKQRRLKYWRVGSQPETASLNGKRKSLFLKINKHLPKSLLKLEGSILYKYKG
jgi:lipid II:glycine glycyltransferase (peptidoglycan interpeptide bridge formation enzyme)